MAKHTIAQVVTLDLFPQIKFIEKDRQLDFDMDDPRSICRFVMGNLHLSPNIKLKDFWDTHKKSVFTKVVKLRNDKTSGIRGAFFGKNTLKLIA